MKICIIGGGSSGLAAIKACKEENLEVECFERSDSFGGVWRYHEEDDPNKPSVMKSTIINTSKEMSAFSDFPPPEDFANFMHNSFMFEYFKLYAEHFDLLRHIRYRREVTNVEMADDYEENGTWLVSVKDLNTGNTFSEAYDGVMVCAGHHIYPHIPKFEGLDEFEGKVLHTHSLKTSAGCEDKNVLVIGIGNSAVDAAVEISQISKKLYLSTRRGSWILSRIGPNGTPYDIFAQKRIFDVIRRFNFFHIADTAMELFANLKFDHEKFGLKPKHRILNAHFTINDALPNNIFSGRVTVKQDVKRFTKDGVVFQEEEEIRKIDVVVLATGYEIRFPFISEEILQVTNNHVNLYKLMFPPQLLHPSLVFIGLIQPLGAIFPIAEAQSRWFVQLMQKKLSLPMRETMEAEIMCRQKEISDLYVFSPRHTIQVYWIPYMDKICSEFGAKPNFWKMALTDPKLFYACIMGPCTPYQYRLQGPHAWAGAREAILSTWNRILAPLKTRKMDSVDTEFPCWKSQSYRN